jgi:hypothetical protein
MPRGPTPPRGRVGHDGDVDGLEIDHQRVGQDVVGAVRTIVERGAVVTLRREQRVVDHDVAGDALDAHLAQAVDETPPAIRIHERVAAALEHEVAVEHLVAHGTGRIGTRAPRVGRPEQLERGERRNDLHRRRRVARHAGVVTHQRLVATDLAHEDTQAGAGDAPLRQHPLDLGRQEGTIGRGQRRGRAEEQQQAGEESSSQVHRVQSGESAR